MTAKDIQMALIWDSYHTSFMLPNFTPVYWWECDVFELTKAGYFREYEIKISRADFKADALKESRGAFNWELRDYGPTKNKHQELATGSTKGPSNFSFVVPEGLITLDEVPVWAGLIVAKPCKWREWPTVEVVKPAPRRHSVKMDASVKETALNACYHRMYSAIFKLRSKTKITDFEIETDAAKESKNLPCKP